MKRLFRSVSTEECAQSLPVRLEEGGRGERLHCLSRQGGKFRWTDDGRLVSGRGNLPCRRCWLGDRFFPN